MMHDYYLRCVEADVPQLLQLGHVLGVLQTVPDTGDVTGGVGSAWDVIGPIHVPTGGTIKGVGDFPDTPELAPRKNSQGEVWWHANLRTHIDLREAAQALVDKNLELGEEHPELEQALANLSKYFVVDAQGQPVPPAEPHRIFSGPTPSVYVPVEFDPSKIAPPPLMDAPAPAPEAPPPPN